LTKRNAPSQTPIEYVEKHKITRHLVSLGVTKKQRQAFQFKKTQRGGPFDLWSFIFPADTPKGAIPFVKSYCALQWLILEDPPWSRDKEDAWRLVSETMAGLIFDFKLKKQRSRKGRRKTRGKITTDGKTMGQLIRALVLDPQQRRSTAAEVWPHLWSLLDSAKLEPKELRNSKNVRKTRYEYNFNRGRKTICFGRFATVVSLARAKRKSR